MQKTLTALALVAVIALGGWLYFSSDQTKNESTSNLPDVVARVNDEEITREDLAESRERIVASQNIDITALNEDEETQLQTQALDALISRTLINQAVLKSGVTAPETEVSNQIEMIKGQFADNVAFVAALQEQNISEADLRNEVTAEIAAQTYFNQELSLESITASEEEISAVYEQESALTEELPPLETVHDEIESFIVQQKREELIVAHVATLRTNANIEILI